MHSAWVALAFGIIAAISLPLGSWIGLATRTGARITSALLAFGAGTLIYAMSVEIVASSFARRGFWPIAIGMVAGGAIFSIANQIVNSRGAFLRKVSVAASYVATQRNRRQQALLKRLAHVHLLQSLPPEDIAPLVQATRVVNLDQGQVLFREGDVGNSLYLVDEGELEVIRGGVRVAILSPGETVGEMAVVTGAPRSATIRALEPAKLFYIPKPAFDDLVHNATRVRDRVSELIALRTEDLKERLLVSKDEADQWMATASARLADQDDATPEEIKEAAKEHENAPLGIWLGNTLDTIPSALVLGSTITGFGSVSWALLAGIVLNNFPEAMSSSSIMKLVGMTRRRILTMWWSTVVVSGVFAAVGNVFFTGARSFTVGIIEGTAAGAMLVMIAETTLPEAYERGGAIVGLSTLCGFIAALAVSSVT